MTSAPRLAVYEDVPALVAAALAKLMVIATDRVAESGRFSVALSGGNTPRALYSAWAEHAELPWQKFVLCFGDERPVPPDHAESNARMVREALTKRAFVPAGSVHRIEAEREPSAAARAYEATLRGLFPGVAWPAFDLMLLGLGTDGHTASLFPHSPALSERTRWVSENAGPSGPRITLTFPVLNAARHTLMLVAGADKAEALQRMLAPDGDVQDTPARGIRPGQGAFTIFADRAAASLLPAQPAVD